MKRISVLAFLLAFAVGSIPAKPATIADLFDAWKAEYPNQWHPWGLQAIDLYGNGQMALVVTQHYGGSRVLKQTDSGWQWAEVGNALGGTFRPVVMDFTSDGVDDLLYRDSLPNTAYANTGGQFQNVGFAYGTGNDPIREITPNWFGHDFARWSIPGFAPIQYQNPHFANLPPDVQADHWTDKAKHGTFYRAWFHEVGGLVSFSGFYSYKKDLPSCRFYFNRRGRLVPVPASLGLPSIGAVVHAQDWNMDGMPDLLISGWGYMVSGPNGYTYTGGILSQFLGEWGEWPHQVFVTGNRLVVSNVRGQVVKVFTHTGAGAFGLVETVWSADGEPVALGDFNDDGTEDIAILKQTGGGKHDIHFIWN